MNEEIREFEIRENCFSIRIQGIVKTNMIKWVDLAGRKL